MIAMLSSMRKTYSVRMSTQSGRIWFIDNPWPGGHAIEEFVWSGRLDADGSLWFDLHLETVDYKSEAAAAIDRGPHWQSTIVWQNYHSCTLSSTNWADEGSKGLAVGGESSPLKWADLNGSTFTADGAEIGDSVDVNVEPAFLIYLTGHDATAGHQVTFKKGAPAGAFDIEWTGKIALVYSGDDELKHTFKAQLAGIEFQGFVVNDELSDEEAKEKFAIACADAGLFKLAVINDKRMFCLK